jgi:type III restriction enzyme
MEVSKTGRALLQGRGPELHTLETEGQMLQRACGDLMGLKNIVVLNDEAHHCYREKPQAEDGEKLKGEDREEAKKNNEAARLWISGIETVKRKLGLTAVYDLSATPFFLRGSGYAEGTLFPWTVSDFSLMDAIECGIVKLPRVPIADNIPGGDMPKFRELWKHVGPKMPKKGRGKSGELDPLSLPNELQTALEALYGHYAKTSRCGRRKASTCRRSLSWCATTLRPRNSSTTSSRASSVRAMAFGSKADLNSSAIMMAMASGSPGRALC